MDDMVGCAITFFMSANVVYQNKFMFPAFMLKKPINTPLFHQTLDKVVIGFSILNLEVELRIRARQPLFKRKGVIRQDFINNINNTFLLKNLEV